MEQIYRAIFVAVESRLHLIGSVITADASRLTTAQKIYDQGDFYNAISYLVTPQPDGFTLAVGSNVRHEPFVLGGKVPSWTPIAPLIAWVTRKSLSWTDRKTGKQLTVEQIAYLIRGKIRREGIPARNIFKTVIDNREQWIYSQLLSIEVPI